MHVLTLYHDLKRRGVRLEADGGRLICGRPAGELSGQDRAALAEAKPVLLRILTPKTDEEPADDGRSCGTHVTGIRNPHSPRGDGERRLVVAGWEPKERGGLVIWANPETGFYCSKRWRCFVLRPEKGRFTEHSRPKKARVMGSGEGIADDSERKP